MNEPVSLLPGYIVTERIRCGRSNCRCARGELHGPYHYRRWRSGGTHHKEYVRSQDLDRTRAACRAWSDLQAQLRENRRRVAKIMAASRWLACHTHEHQEDEWNR